MVKNDHVQHSPRSDNRLGAYIHVARGNARRSHTHAAHLVVLRVLVLLAALTLLPVAYILRDLAAPSVGGLRLPANAQVRPCISAAQRCDGDDAGDADAVVRSPDAATPVPTPPPCGPLCARIERTFHDPRTRQLLTLLAQTPTGRGALDYLLAMGARLGEGFLSWHDLRADGSYGATTAGGFIQLNSAALTRSDAGPYLLAGTLVHESVESYFDIAEGIRSMSARHADYVAQWFNGKFERELHVIPYFHEHDYFYRPADNSSYGLSYDAWLHGTEDGALYRDNAEHSDLHAIDRKGRAWPPSDQLAEQGGLLFFGQGKDVTPIPNTMGLSPAMLVADDLGALAR